ncbi:MAG: hypothetical protein CR982_01420 [Candidatus Cloacimonadota bacterium]|nr:MAG: hypothetical protein CR982_01420 [Candidatus Cloacimonadota bacterium]PIE79568.1 MAG: hypothetical protein CSA15_02805 [Candidatus Delongbacteria bacterium]
MLHRFSDSKIIFESDDSLGKFIGDIKNLQFVHLSISKNGLIASHKLDVEVIFHVLNGRGEIVVDGNKTSLFKGDIISVNPNCNREWINSGSNPLELLVIKVMD